MNDNNYGKTLGELDNNSCKNNIKTNTKSAIDIEIEELERNLPSQPVMRKSLTTRELIKGIDMSDLESDYREKLSIYEKAIRKLERKKKEKLLSESNQSKVKKEEPVKITNFKIDSIFHRNQDENYNLENASNQQLNPDNNTFNKKNNNKSKTISNSTISITSKNPLREPLREKKREVDKKVSTQNLDENLPKVENNTKCNKNTTTDVYLSNTDNNYFYNSNNNCKKSDKYTSFSDKKVLNPSISEIYEKSTISHMNFDNNCMSKKKTNQKNGKKDDIDFHQENSFRLIDGILKNVTIKNLSFEAIRQKICNYYDRKNLLSQLEVIELKKYAAHHLVYFIKGMFEEQKMNLNSWHIWEMATHIIDFFIQAKFGKLIKDESLAKLAINAPPRNHKSFIFTHLFSIWLLAIDPEDQIIINSCNMSLATRNHKIISSLMKSNFYTTNFPNTILKNCSKNNIITSKDGNIITTSLFTGAIGRGANIVIVDDPHNHSHTHSEKRLKSTIDNFKNSVYSRIERSRTNCKSPGGLIVVMQRLSHHDLMKHIINQDTIYDAEILPWQILIMPLIQESNRTLSIFGCRIDIREGDIMNPEQNTEKNIMRWMGFKNSHIFKTQYQQYTVEYDDAIIRRETIQRYQYEVFRRQHERYIKSLKYEKESSGEEDNLSVSGGIYVYEFGSHDKSYDINLNFVENENSKNQYDMQDEKTGQLKLQIVHSVDTATSADKNDYSVCSTWNITEDGYQLIDVVRKQVDYNGLESMVCQQYALYGGEVLIEDCPSAAGLISRLENTIPIIPRKPRFNKKERMKRVLHFFERGKVYLPDYNTIPNCDSYTKTWLKNFESEILDFPHTKYDDQIDTVSQFFLWVMEQEFKNDSQRNIFVSKI